MFLTQYLPSQCYGSYVAHFLYTQYSVKGYIIKITVLWRLISIDEVPHFFIDSMLFDCA